MTAMKSAGQCNSEMTPPDLFCRVHTINFERLAIRYPTRSALTARTIVYNLMGKQIAINAKVILACRTLISTAYTHALCLALGDLPVIFRRYCGEWETACKARRAS